MIQVLVWSLAIALGVTLCGLLGKRDDLVSSMAAAGIILVTFWITPLFKVARCRRVSKMGTDWLTHELRQMVWRMLLTLLFAALVFRLMYPNWGVAYWLCVAGYYQVGLLLHLRNIRRTF